MSTHPLVVGVAIVRHGRVLAARRAAPARIAGGWELPGGKVEPGEDPELAAVREIAEELGCRIQVAARLGGEVELPTGGHLLRVYRASLAAGEPSPNPADHDALRWLGPEELEEVPWLAADRAFLPELREILLDGDPFEDGNVGGAARIGMTVRRPTGPWTPAVHRLLAFLDDAGLDGVPRVLGTDERGRESLTYLPGSRVDVDQETVSDALLVDAVRWLRCYHDVVRGFRPAGALPWRNDARALRADEIICHHDPGAYNWVTDETERRLVGVVDWDMAGPGLPVEDLAFMAWTSVPVFRPTPAGDVARRLHLMAAAYGDRSLDARALLAAVDARMAAATDKIAAGQSRGDPGMLNLADAGEPGRTRARLRAMRERVPAIEDALDRTVKTR